MGTLISINSALNWLNGSTLCLVMWLATERKIYVIDKRVKYDYKLFYNNQLVEHMEQIKNCGISFHRLNTILH